MLNIDEIIIDNVSSYDIISPDFKKLDNTRLFKDEPKTRSTVCMINNLIMIPETRLFSPSWEETFTKLIGKSVKFYKFMNTIYAYEVDGKKTYMKQQFVMPIIFTSVVGALLYF